MGSPTFAALAANYPRKPDIDTAALYNSIGHPEYADSAYMQNTCAVRVSIALLGAGIQPTPGHMSVKAGRFRGKRIEQSQKRLSEFLSKRLGKPEVYPSGYAAWSGIRQRRGIVSFFRLNSDTDSQGHIDLVEPTTASDLKCAGACYWAAREVWFWSLK